ncbi:MAG: LuxR C-terminal-related transcriptional regulator [Chloroflexota bacterium]|nr:LuxR C-terminal-related transcriptional regulator [Chloroflexota bacterium]
MSDQTAATIRPAPPPHDPPAWSDLTASLSTREAARALGVTERTVRRAIARGDLVAVKAGRAFRIPAAAIAGLRTGQSGQPSSTRPLLHLVDRAGDGDDRREATEWTMFTGPAVPLVRLPAPLTGFIGRDQQVAAVSDLLLQDDTRLVTLTGVGGVGKTRLAIRVAEAMVTRFADGVVFVPLASVQDPALVATTIAQTVGLRESLARSPVDELCAFLRTRRLLLVVDNFEHVTAAAPELVTLLSSCPKLTLLVTSRVPLRVSGERVSVVPPLRLPTPPGADSPQPASLTGHGQVEAIQLFVERARAARADFTLSPDQAPTVAAICTRLDGLPLAIELAAARCTVLTPESMLARLEQRLPLLTDGPRDQPGRLRTMRDAIAWSYDLLRPDEQSLFQRLSVFAGGFTLPAAEAMLPRPGASPAEGNEAVLARLEALVGHNLIIAVERTAADLLPGRGAELRFTMLETIREFGREKLAASGDAATAHARHAAYVLALANAAGPAATPATLASWFDRMELERDNARVALAWAIEHRQIDTAPRLAAALSPLWHGRGPYGEGRDWLEQALALGDGPPPARLAALIALVRLLCLQGEFGRAAALGDDAVRLARATGDRLTIARSLAVAGLAVDRQGNQARAAAFFEEALSLFQDVGDPTGEAETLDHLGASAWIRGEAKRFGALAEASLRLRLQLGDTVGVIASLDRLSLVARQRRDLRRQAALASEIVRLSRTVEDPYIIASSLWTAAAIAGERGQATLSARLFGAEEALRQATGFVLDPAFADDYAKMVVTIRATLGEVRLGAIWAAGRLLSPAQALAEAMAAMDHLAADSTPATASDGSAAWFTVYGLTPREREVLRLVVSGNSDKEIAAALFVARATASKHVSAILDKLGAESRTAAAAIAYRDGLL